MFFGVACLYWIVWICFLILWLIDPESNSRLEPATGLIEAVMSAIFFLSSFILERSGEFQQLYKRIRGHVTVEHEKTRELIHENSSANLVPASLQSATHAVKNAYSSLDAVNETERAAAFATLLESDDPMAIQALELAVKHSTPSVRIKAALTLAEKTECKNEKALSGLLEALKGSESDTKIRALDFIHYTFGNFPSAVKSTEIEQLVQALADSDNDVRWAAERVLIGQCQESLPYLVEAIGHEGTYVRLAALEAVWIISEQNILTNQQLHSAVPALIEALNDGDQAPTPRDQEYTSVSKFAAKILVSLSPVKELSEYIQNDRTWMHKHVEKILERIREKSQ